MIINQLSYHVQVDGAGPSLLLLHGFTGSADSWVEVLPMLTSHFKVIRVDLPGHGRTELPKDVQRYRIESTTQDLADLLRELNCAPAHVWGYSMGARVALYLALVHPEVVQRLVLESGSPGLATEAERAARRASDEALATRIEQNGIYAFVEEWECLSLWASQRRLLQTQRDRLRQQRLSNATEGLANSLRYLGTGAQPALWDRLVALQPPALFIAGEEDTKFVQIAQQMQTHCPPAQRLIVPHAGHAIHLEQPRAITDAVLAFCGMT